MSNTLVFTIGYEGWSIDDFVEYVARHAIDTLIDVRELPLSRKKGFSKKSLGEAFKARGIQYTHMKALGTPRPIRRQLEQTRDYPGFFTAYKQHLTKNTDAFNRLKTTARSLRVCLMCFEQDVTTCHRSILTEKLQSESFRVKHI